MSRDATDLNLRESKVLWFDGEATDCDGTVVRMYSVVTLVKPVHQNYAQDDEPIVVEPGRRLVVIGAADGDKGLLWMDVDDPGPFAGANLCLPTNDIRYLCEVGDDLHMKSSH